jgi:hypothetical protein
VVPLKRRASPSDVANAIKPPPAPALIPAAAPAPEAAAIKEVS